MIFVSLLLIVLAMFGAPLFAIIAASAMVGFHSNDTELMTIALELLSIAQMPILSAIPLFTFAGYLLSESEAPERLVRLTRRCSAGCPAVWLSCAWPPARSSRPSPAHPASRSLRWARSLPGAKAGRLQRQFNLGLVTSSGSLGLLFAPSLPLILYGVVAEVSIDDLFLAGILPGLLMLVMLAGCSIWVNRDNRKPLSAFSLREVGAACAKRSGSCRCRLSCSAEFTRASSRCRKLRR